MKYPSKEQCLEWFVMHGFGADTLTKFGEEEAQALIHRAYKAGAEAMREEAANITADQRWMVLDPTRTYNAHENLQAQKQTAEYLTRQIRNLKVEE